MNTEPNFERKNFPRESLMNVCIQLLLIFHSVLLTFIYTVRTNTHIQTYIGKLRHYIYWIEYRKDDAISLKIYTRTYTQKGYVRNIRLYVIHRWNINPQLLILFELIIIFNLLSCTHTHTIYVYKLLTALQQ